jgi:CheY-like chemotaxis protein
MADTGAGMDEAARRRAFEPFVNPGCGRPGLDLAAVHGIAAQHGGAVSLESQPGRGSAFTLLLPAACAPSRAALPDHPKDAGSATVLVVEDDTTVRELAVEVLRGAGYQVLEASDGEDALSLCAERSGDIGLVLLDSVMPRMGGRETYLALKARWPSLRVVFVSGYSPEAGGTAFVEEHGLALIQKPYTIDELLGKVREALARP